MSKYLILLNVLLTLTFKELTEEGLPFLILFHRAEDLMSVSLFAKAVKEQLFHMKSN